MNRARTTILVLALLTTGCATIVSGGRTTQGVLIDTVPQGATAAAGETRCTTPCRLELGRRDDAIVALSLDGYDPREVVLRSRVRLVTAANVVWGPGLAFGLPADLASGAGYEVVPAAAVVPLERSAPRVVPAGGAASATAPPPTPAAPVVLAPAPPRRLNVGVELGFGKSAIDPVDDVGVVTIAAVPTFRVAGPLVLGGAAHAATELVALFHTASSETTIAAVAGVDLAPSRNTRLALLGQGGVHRASGGWGRVALPQLGVRARASLLFRDHLMLGLWGALAFDLGTRAADASPGERVGGRSVAAGIAIGGYGR
jgi:hypothetical protein